MHPSRPRASSGSPHEEQAPILLSGGCAFPPGVVDMWRDNALCDAELLCAGGASFRAHRVVLAGSSDYFRARLQEGFWADSSGALDLPDMPAAALEATLNFLYAGECQLPGDGELLGAVVMAAARLQVAKLQSAAEAALAARLAPTNALSMWRAAEALSLPALRAAAQATAAAAFAEVVADAAFVEAPLECAVALLADDRLAATESEIPVYEAAVRYLRAQPAQPPPAKTVEAIFSAVRFPLLGNSFLQAALRDEPLLQGEPGLRIVTESVAAMGGPALARGSPTALYVLGGRGGKACSASSCIVRFETPNAGGGSSVWREAPAAACARSGGSAAELDGAIYVAGGLGDGGVRLDSVERFSAARGAWEAVEPMAAARVGCAAASLRGRLYVIGGYGGASFLSSVESYDPDCGAWRDEAPMAESRSYMGCAVLDGKLYVAGGGGRSCLRSVEVFDAARGEWEPVAPMLTPRREPGMAAIGGKLYVVGGSGTDGAALSSAESFDPARGTWVAVAPMGTARRGLCAAAIGGKLYAMGGVGPFGRDLRCVECYDAERDQWRQAAPLPAPRVRAMAAAVAATHQERPPNSPAGTRGVPFGSMHRSASLARGGAPPAAPAVVPLVNS